MSNLPLERALRQVDRLSKDFSIYKRHAEAMLARAREAAQLELLGSLGDVVLHLEAAVEQSRKDPEAVRHGVTMVIRGLRKVFDEHGLQRIPTRGQPFDPRIHEAVLMEPRPGVDRGIVLQELSPGFYTDEQVIRPAKVSVAR